MSKRVRFPLPGVVLVAFVFLAAPQFAAAPNKPGTVVMQTAADQFQLAPGGQNTAGPFTYPGIRHVSLTLAVQPVIPPGQLLHSISVEGAFGNTQNLATIVSVQDFRVVTVEFDTSSWQIDANNLSNMNLINVAYNYSVTYPANQ